MQLIFFFFNRYSSASPFLCPTAALSNFSSYAPSLSLLLFSSCLLFSPSVICRGQLLSFPEKSPLLISGVAQNDFYLLIYCLTSSSASLRRQRASQVLRYCHLQFLFYLRFFILQYHVGWTDPLYPLSSYNVSTFFLVAFSLSFMIAVVF